MRSVAKKRPSAACKGCALSYASNLVIAVASVAPGYSLAATLGFVVAIAGVGLKAPAVLWVSFVPMLCIAFAYYFIHGVVG